MFDCSNEILLIKSENSSKINIKFVPNKFFVNIVFIHFKS